MQDVFDKYCERKVVTLRPENKFITIVIEMKIVFA